MFLILFTFLEIMFIKKKSCLNKPLVIQTSNDKFILPVSFKTPPGAIKIPLPIIDPTIIVQP